jgi:Holliday junction DNA helicase RuvA
MIATLEGILAEATPTSVIMEINGVGYEVNVPLTTAERLPVLGKKAKLFIRAIYREDTQALYGFSSREDKDLFNVIIDKVSGVGPKIALGILSQHNAETLKAAIATEDVKLLSKCPGIGKKSAERIIVELKDFMGASLLSSTATSAVKSTTAINPASATAQNLQDAVAALAALGYKGVEAEKAILKTMKILGEDTSVEELVKGALQK